MNPLILIGILLILLIAAGMYAALQASNKATQKQRTMAVIRGRAGGGENAARDPRSETDRRRAEIAKKLKEQDTADGGDSGKKKITIGAMMEQAGMKANPRKFWIFSLIFAVVFSIAAKLVDGSSLLSLLFFVIGLFGIPRIFLKKRIKRRQKKFLDEFADALEAMARLLKAGMPVSAAVDMAGREFEGPVGEEMSRMYEAQKIGIPLPEAALQAARRVPVTEMQMFATGLSIQAQTGASLSEVLINLAKVIRARYRLRRKVQALSSEAKSSAMIIGSLPFLIGTGLFLINPDYMDPLFHTPIGKALMAAAGCWMGMGIFVMKAMINFKI